MLKFAGFMFAFLFVGCCRGYNEGCFLKGTAIATPRGDVAIEVLKVGDEVLSFDDATQSIEVSYVDAVINHEVSEYLKIEIDGLPDTFVTADHPLFDFDQNRWRPAGEFTEGDGLRTLQPSVHEYRTERSLIRGLSKVEQTDGAKARVYNLKVRNQQSTFANRVAAHFY
jgi:hypothetical protein